jgi:MFS family permease
MRYSNFRLFAGGMLGSTFGLQMLGTGIAWELYERTSDAMVLGYTGLARALPVILLAIPAGVVVDRFDRRYVLAVGQLAFAVTTLMLAWASATHQPVWLMIALLSLTGFARVFAGPARATLLPSIVPRNTFENAVTWASGIFQFSAMAGPILAGFIIRQAEAAWPVYVCTAVGTLGFAVAPLFMHPIDGAVHNKEPISFGSMTAGFRHVWNEKTVLSTITLDLFAVLFGGATAMLPIYAKDILHVDAVGLGMLKAAPYFGALIMAVVLANRPRFKRAGASLLWAVAGFGAATIVFGLSKNLGLSIFALAIAGAVDNISVVIRHVLVQVRTPKEVRGRVSAVNTIFIESSNEIGAFESGLVAKFFGPVFSVVSGGIATLIVVACVARFVPELRRLGELREAEDQPTEPPKH